VSANDILRAAGPVDGLEQNPTSELLVKVVIPALSVAERAFGLALSRINLDDMARHAENLHAGNESGAKP
jgi:hypothetical protein